VKEISFSCTDFINDIAYNTIERNLRIEVGFGFHLLKDKNEFGVRTLVQYLFKGDEVLKYENQIDFDVKNIDQVVDLEKDKLNIKDGFLLSLLSVVIGTSCHACLPASVRQGFCFISYT